MKKMICILSVFSIHFLLFSLVSASEIYNITQLTFNSRGNYFYDINNNGYVVWQGGGNYYLDEEIFLYNGSSITQLTNNDYDDAHPVINDNGYVVWQRYDGSDWEIILYNGASTTQITNNDYHDRNTEINNNGHIVWEGCETCAHDEQIFLYNESNIIQLTNNDHGNDHPIINDNGFVVWDSRGYFLYDGSIATQITSNNYDPYSRSHVINNEGYVVWDGENGYRNAIYLYDGRSTTQLTDNQLGDYNPDINDNGYVAWQSHDGSDYEIFLYDGSEIHQLTNNEYDDIEPKISDNGNIVWRGDYDNEFEIFYAVPSGQSEPIDTLTFPLEGAFADRNPNLKFGADWPWGECPTGVSKRHTGVDLSAQAGESVYAAHSGTVRAVIDASSDDWAWGLTIEDDSNEFTTVYWHVDPKVYENVHVNKGDKIATVADLSDNTHLHFGVRKAPYSNISNAGSLPRSDCGGYPAWPEYFVDPSSLQYEPNPNQSPTSTIYDNFLDEYIDQELWRIRDQGDNFEQQDGALKFSNNNYGNYAHLNSKVFFQGDFIFEVGWSNFNYDGEIIIEENDPQLDFEVMLSDPLTSSKTLMGIFRSPTPYYADQQNEEYLSYGQVDGVWLEAQSAPTDQTSGKFRIVREGEVVKTQYWQDAQWNTLLTADYFGPEDVLLQIGGYNGDNFNANFTGQFDYVKIVQGTPAGSLVDSDGDGVPDSEDAFPDDPNEWSDNDADGIGDNADTDDDNDGMTDEWENQYEGLDPLTDDADGDLDNDGYTNYEEYQSDTNPEDDTSYPISQYTLNVSNVDNGSVTGPGIDCPGDCSEVYSEGSLIELTANPDSGYAIGSWDGCDATWSDKCSVIMDQNKNIELYMKIDKQKLIERIDKEYSKAMNSIYSLNLMDYDSYNSFMGKIGAGSGIVFNEWSSWIKHENINDLYLEHYYNGVEFNSLRKQSLHLAKLQIENNNLSKAKKYYENSLLYALASYESFSAASKCFENSLEEAQVIADAIKSTCESVVISGVTIVGGPTAGKIVSYGYNGLDYFLDRELVGRDEALKNLILKVTLNTIMNQVKFEELNNRTLSNYLKNRVGKFTFPALQKLVKNNEYAQYVLSNMIKDAVVDKFGDAAIDFSKLTDEITNQIVEGINYQRSEVHSPVYIYVKDSDGNITGLKEGEIFNQIPGSIYANEKIEIYDATSGYEYFLNGKSNGQYTFQIFRNANELQFQAENIPVLINETHKYQMLDDTKLKIEVDKDADNSYEYSIDFNTINDNYITEKEFIDKIEALYIEGDLDGDGDCDYDDYLIFRGCYGACDGNANYMPGADLDGDGCVTMNDYRQFRGLVQ